MTIDENYFMDADDDMVEYLTAKLEAEFTQKEASYEKVREGAEKLLNLLVAGIGGAVLLIFNVSRSVPAETAALYGLSVLLLGWVVCVLYLLQSCIRACHRPSRFSTPDVLFHEDTETGKVTLGKLKRERIFYVSGYISELKGIIEKRANYLDDARYIAVLSPLAGFAIYMFLLSFY